MKRAIFIGNRYNVLKRILDDKYFTLSKIYAVENSVLVNELVNRKLEYKELKLTSKDELIEDLIVQDFDLLVSNGCPFKLPISKLKKNGRLFINIHPSYLPFLKGKHPINGAVLNEYKFIGATAHFMDDDIDSGNIICQQKVELTDDLDLGLLYRISFELESEVFAEAVSILQKYNFDYGGIKQKPINSYYSRKLEDQTVSFSEMSSDEILRRVRAFGIKSQGVHTELEGKYFILFDAEKITNYYLIEKHKQIEPGRILLAYDERMLIKTKDGIIKIKSYQKMSE